MGSLIGVPPNKKKVIEASPLKDETQLLVTAYSGKFKSFNLINLSDFPFLLFGQILTHDLTLYL